MVASSGDIVLTESYTYSGMLALSAQSSYRLHGVATDASGLIPESLDRAFAETGCAGAVLHADAADADGLGDAPGTAAGDRRDRRASMTLICWKTMPTAICCRRHCTPISRLIPERSFYIVSFAKCLAPGLRIAAMIAPEAFRDRCDQCAARDRLDGGAGHGRSGRAA